MIVPDLIVRPISWLQLNLDAIFMLFFIAGFVFKITLLPLLRMKNMFDWVYPCPCTYSQSDQIPVPARLQ